MPLEASASGRFHRISALRGAATGRTAGSELLANGASARETRRRRRIAARDEQRIAGKAIRVLQLAAVNPPEFEIPRLNRVVMQGQKKVAPADAAAAVRSVSLSKSPCSPMSRVRKPCSRSARSTTSASPRLKANSGSPRALVAPGRDRVPDVNGDQGTF